MKLSKLAMLLARCSGECKDRRRAEISCAEARRLARVMLEVSRLGGSGRERDGWRSATSWPRGRKSNWMQREVGGRARDSRAKRVVMAGEKDVGRGAESRAASFFEVRISCIRCQCSHTHTHTVTEMRHEEEIQIKENNGGNA